MALIKYLIFIILIAFSKPAFPNYIYAPTWDGLQYSNFHDYCRERLDLDHALTGNYINYFFTKTTFSFGSIKCSFDTNYQDGSISSGNINTYSYKPESSDLIDSCPEGTQLQLGYPKTSDNYIKRYICVDPPDSGNCNYLIQTGLNSFLTKKVYSSLAPMYVKVDVGNGSMCEYKKVAIGDVDVDGVEGCRSTQYLATGKDGKARESEFDTFLLCGGDSYTPPPEETPQCAEGWSEWSEDFGCYPTDGSACPAGTFYDSVNNACIDEQGQVTEQLSDGTVINIDTKKEIIKNQDGTVTEKEYSKRTVVAPDGSIQEVDYVNTTTYDNKPKQIQLELNERNLEDVKKIEEYSNSMGEEIDTSPLGDEESTDIGFFDTSSIFGNDPSLQCPAGSPFEIFGQEFSFNYDLFCQMAEMFSFVLLFFGYLQGARIIFGGNE